MEEKGEERRRENGGREIVDEWGRRGREGKEMEGKRETRVKEVMETEERW